jgi:hypothetical protein
MGCATDDRVRMGQRTRKLTGVAGVRTLSVLALPEQSGFHASCKVKERVVVQAPLLSSGGIAKPACRAGLSHNFVFRSRIRAL